MFRSLSVVLSLVSLSACTGPADCSDCNNTGSDLDSEDGIQDCDAACDTGTEDPSGTATITMDVLRIGEKEDCLVNLIGTSTYSDASSAAITVDAPDTYTAVAGDPSYTDQFSFPIHVDADGEYWAAEPQEVEVQDGDVVDKEFYLFNLFEPAVYTCSYDKYEFDADNEDKKGDYISTVDLDPQYIAVDENGQVQAEDDPTMGAVGSMDDQVKVEDDHLVLEVADTDFTVYITTSEIGKDFFSLTVVSETGLYVKDLICNQ